MTREGVPRRDRELNPPCWIGSSGSRFATAPRCSSSRSWSPPGGGSPSATLTIEAFPDPTDTQVNVITIFPGQPTEEVERQIGLPLERALNGTPGLSRLRNLSLFGLSYVTLTFNDGVDGTVGAPAGARAAARRRAARTA